ncbi:hypothetical protein L195_g022025 [Trifolium pratense]|uniref:Uncharacterized protein n=1 Tax=Trifolium pratense TaxID=57577 RepID=A0A2K3N6V8_TRIPR|nr:hypothetical protein L195_g022025 [Trifolium pratense]
MVEVGVPSSNMKTFYNVRQNNIRTSSLCMHGAVGGACACGAIELAWRTD